MNMEGRHDKLVEAISVFDTLVDYRSATRRCLNLPEVFHRIVEHFVTSGDRATLSRLARTCATFHETAQNALWKDADLVNVLQCFPGTCWEMHKSFFVSSRSLDKPTSDSEPNRISALYARHPLRNGIDFCSRPRAYEPWPAATGMMSTRM